jgi:hypothetical protein
MIVPSPPLAVRLLNRRSITHGKMDRSSEYTAACSLDFGPFFIPVLFFWQLLNLEFE